MVGFCYLLTVALGVTRVLVALGHITMVPGGHLAQTYQAIAHGFVFLLFGAWLMHRGIEKRLHKDSLEYAVQPPSYVWWRVESYNRGWLMEIVVILSIVEVMSVIIQKLG